MGFELTIAEGKGRGQRFEFDADDVTIGRGADNDVVLNDAGVSRNHARIRRQGAQWLLLDNGTANGTELNGGVIQGPAALRTGDRIGVGPIIFRFEAQREEPVRLPAAGATDGETRITAQPGAPRSEETRVSSLPVQGQAKTVAPKAGAGQGARNLVGAFTAMSPKARFAVVVGVVLFIGLVGAQIMKAGPQSRVKCPSVVGVDDQTADFSFGRGEVEVDCGASVSFGFNVPPKTRALFHYVATRVASPSELELKLNGKHLGWAPVASARGEPQVLSLPPEELSSDGKNIVQFVQGTRGKDYMVSKVRVELFAITVGDLKAAQVAYERGRRRLEERRVAPRNLYDAWKNFTNARRALEGLSPKPALYDEVAQLIRDAEKDLEKKCAQLLFTAQRFERYGQDERAQQTYHEVLLHFPGDDLSGCRKKAQENIVSQQVGEE